MTLELTKILNRLGIDKKTRYTVPRPLTTRPETHEHTAGHPRIWAETP